VAGAALGGIALQFALTPGETSARKRKKHKKRCIKNSTPDGSTPKRCARSKDCCQGGTCCDFGEGSVCVNLRTNPTACGTSCENAENCQNTVLDAECRDGTCLF
jgi:hypothetical protein